MSTIEENSNITTTTTTTSSTDSSTTTTDTNNNNNNIQPENDTDIIRSMWETPSIYQYLSFFRQPLGIKVLSSDDLENYLLNPKNNIKYLGDLFIPLLKDLLPVTKARTINYTNWESFLNQELNKENNFFSCFEENPFSVSTTEESSFSNITLKNRVLLLKSVCDWNLSKSPHILEYVKEFITNEETDKLRNLPLGILNDQKEFYWYFGDYRLYKETLQVSAGSKKRVKNKKNSGGGVSEEGENAKWEIICSTKEEWEEFIKKYESFGLDEEESDEKILFVNLNDVLPQVLSKLQSIKRKKGMFGNGNISGGNGPKLNVSEPRQWKSMRLLAQNLKKKEQEELMQIQQQQQHQLDLDPYNRPRSGRMRTNLIFDDSGVLNGTNNESSDLFNDDNNNNSRSKRTKNDTDGDYQDKNRQHQHQAEQQQQQDDEPVVHFSRSGRRIVTASHDEFGRLIIPTTSTPITTTTTTKIITTTPTPITTTDSNMVIENQQDENQQDSNDTVNNNTATTTTTNENENEIIENNNTTDDNNIMAVEK